MELRKRPRPQGVDPDFVSSSPPLPPWNRARCGVGIRSPVAAGLQPSRHENPDMWTEVFKNLAGTDLVRLSLTCRWFHGLLADDSIWRYAFFRDLSLPTGIAHAFRPRPLHRSWRLLYCAAQSYCFPQPEKHVDWCRIGGFLLDSPSLLLTGMLALPRGSTPAVDSVQITIETTGACHLTNVRPGIWIADMNLVGCSMCNHSKCLGMMQVLDARHCELYLQENLREGTWEYYDIGAHLNKKSDTAAAAIFNPRHLASQHVADVLNAESWIRERPNLQPKGKLTPVAVAISTNVRPNNGLLSRFQAVQDMTRGGQTVSVRITQQLL